MAVDVEKERKAEITECVHHVWPRQWCFARYTCHRRAFVRICGSIRTVCDSQVVDWPATDFHDRETVRRAGCGFVWKELVPCNEICSEESPPRGVTRRRCGLLPNSFGHLSVVVVVVVVVALVVVPAARITPAGLSPVYHNVSRSWQWRKWDTARREEAIIIMLRR